MKSKRYYVIAVWTDPADLGLFLLRKYDNDGMGYTRIEAMRMCNRLTREGKYCSVKEFRKGGE